MQSIDTPSFISSHHQPITPQLSMTQRSRSLYSYVFDKFDSPTQCLKDTSPPGPCLTYDHRASKEWNSRHALTSRLPDEMLCEIFEFYCSDPSTRCNQAPLIIGGVCKHWRDVTLATPQLWTTIDISLNPRLEDEFDRVDITAMWLRRSRCLPLSLSVYLEDYLDKDWSDFAITIALLRDHSRRWRNVKIESFCDPTVAASLFNSLEFLPSDLETLTLGETDEERREYPNDRLLSPKTLRVNANGSIIGLDLGWDRLTSLDVVTALYTEEFLHIVGHAANLVSCTIAGLEEIGDAFDMPEGNNVTNRSLKSLKIHSATEGIFDSPLENVTFPSLEELSYTYLSSSPEDDDILILYDFLERSSPQLHSFSFSITPIAGHPYTDLWYFNKPIDITELVLDTSRMYPGGCCAYREEKVRTAREFFSQLSGALYNGIFPKLQELVLKVPLTPKFWLFLDDFLQRLPRIYALYNSDSTRPPILRLSSVVIEELRPQIWRKTALLRMDPVVCSNLMETEHSGIAITLRNPSNSSVCSLSNVIVY